MIEEVIRIIPNVVDNVDISLSPAITYLSSPTDQIASCSENILSAKDSPSILSTITTNGTNSQNTSKYKE